MSAVESTAYSPPELSRCGHGQAGSGGSCLDWPAPDSLGRWHCVFCGCFTADPDRLHSWCRPLTQPRTNNNRRPRRRRR